jgi:excisionase family DNA binding protein
LQNDHVEAEWVDYPTGVRFSGLSYSTLRRYVGRGDIKAARVGRSVKIHLPSLRQFMERKAGAADQ